MNERTAVCVVRSQWFRWVPTMKRMIAIGVISGLFGAACSSGGSAAPTTAPVAVTTTVAETSTAATTTLPPPTSTTSTAPATTLPATTTTVATEDLIKQAVQDYITAYFACGQAPAQCDPTTFTATEGRSRATITELIAGMTREGLYFSTELRGSHISPLSVQVVNQDEATVESCWYDAGVVLGPVGPDGQPTVVNDQSGSARYSHTVFNENGTWRVAEQSELTNLGDGDACGTAP